MDTTADRIYRIRVRADVETAWRALTEANKVREYYFDTAPRTDWEVGSPIDYVDAEGTVAMTGRVLSFDPLRGFSHTFIPTWGGEEDDQGTLTWSLQPEGDETVITLVHAGGHGAETLEGSAQLMRALAGVLGGEVLESAAG